MPLFALVPAAGRGERFGGAKLLTRWRDRELLGHVLAVLSHARAAGLVSEVFVVHRPDDEAVARVAREYHAQPVGADDPGGKLSDTIRRGLAEIRRHDSVPGRSAVLICLGDQPLLRLDVIQALLQSWRTGRRAVRPWYRDDPEVPGHPMLIDRSLWPLALELAGEAGFDPVLRSRGVSIDTVPVGGRNPDVDTAADFLALDAQGPG